jgi:hypothetical protein
MHPHNYTRENVPPVYTIVVAKGHSLQFMIKHIKKTKGLV